MESTHSLLSAVNRCLTCWFPPKENSSVSRPQGNLQHLEKRSINRQSSTRYLKGDTLFPLDCHRLSLLNEKEETTDILNLFYMGRVKL